MTEQHPVEATVHGDTRIDPYAWLRDRDDEAVLEHLREENTWTDTCLAHLEETREGLFGEIRSRIVETDLSVPVRRGPWWYYSRTVEGLSYPIHCRRPAAADEPTPISPAADEAEVVLYDENVEAGGREFFSVGILAVSPDHQALAEATDVVGNERYTLRFRRLDGTEDPTEAISDVSYGFAWAKDSTTVFYTRVDDAWRPHQLWRHAVGTDPTDDVLVLEEPDARFNVGVGKTRDGERIIVSISSSTTSETRVLDADDPMAEPRVLLERVEGVEHGVEHLVTEAGERFWLVVTNADGAIDFRVDIAGDDPDGSAAFTPLIPHRPGIRIDGVDAFATALIVSERAEAETRLRVLDLGVEGRRLDASLLETGWEVTTPERPQTTWLGQNPEASSRVLRIGQTSMVTPTTVAELDLDTRVISVLKRQEVPGGYEPERYVTYLDWATSPDGTRVPVSVVHRRDLLGDGAAPGDAPLEPAPCLLYGYGSYEISMDPTFSPTRLVLLDRGIVFAIAHVRGGGEMGRRWYDEGHLAAKHHSFDDFAAVAGHLIAKKVTSPDRLAGRGGSAGGLLMGAVANRAPDRFQALLAEVPFVDALNTMLDPSLPLTVGEYEEWGNPTDDPEAYATIKSYAPYENISAFEADGSPRRYPAMLLTGGLNDTRVGFWEPAKFVARLREHVPGADVLLRMEMGVGHGGPSGRYDSWREEAFVLAWLLERIGALELRP
jgi:oligopeptidase B